MMFTVVWTLVVVALLAIPTDAQTTTTAAPVEFSPTPIVCTGFRQELVKIPVLQESEGIFSYVYACDEIRSGNCKFPSSTMTLKKPCSLQCSCIRTKNGRYQIGDCYNYCRMPTVGQKCYVNGTTTDGCCPSYTGCIPNLNTPFGSITLNRPVQFPPYKSQRFRCLPGDILPLSACLLFLKREAVPALKFEYGMAATCRCIAEDVFGFSLATPTIPDIPVQRYILLQRAGKILKQPVNAVPFTPPDLKTT
ncbi:hypothetical protein BV898_03858 [Hypsibius exemplaris]|uniref:VWFC domain-containing protein n=1 Tax=Hypsibius exemplaris TaxID=2072580 RepID=A0A1W0X4Z4_HYPEX|nr:hypothetical protein BV898_03858 [Hypsibius exemplaris]